MPGCSSCASSTQCHSCAVGFLLVNSTCSCPTAKYYNPNTGTCMTCSSYCVTCSGPSPYECTSCNSTLKRILIGN